MSDPNGPLCPKCRRRIAAWRLDHCVYCGQVFPEGLRDGFAEPEALKWVERPSIPPDAARQLEMMKVIPFEKEKRSRSLVLAATFLSVPIFGAVFFLLYSLLSRYSPSSAVVVLIGGVGFLAYLVWMLAKRR